MKIDSSATIILFLSNESIRNHIQSHEIFVGSSGYPGIDHFQPNNFDNAYQFGKKQAKKDKILRIIELLNQSKLGNLFDETRELCHKNQEFIYCENKTTFF